MKQSTLFIPNGVIPEKDLAKIKAELTLKNPEYSSAARFTKWKSSISVPEFSTHYEETEHGLHVPRNININLYTSSLYSIIDNTVLGIKANIVFKGSLRKYQSIFFSELDFSQDDHIFAMPCGHGKTVSAIYYSAQVNRKTIILVPTNYLQKQWQKVLNWTTGQTPYTVKDSNSFRVTDNMIRDHDYFLFTTDMYESLLSNKTAELAKLLDVVGLVIMDEAHRLGASTYEPLIISMPAKKRLALTATFRRQDGREKILLYHFGTLNVLENQFPPAHFYAYETGVRIGKLLLKEKLTQNVIAIIETLGHPYEESKRYINYQGNAEQLIQLLKTKTIDRETRKQLTRDLIFAQLDNYVVEHSSRMKQTQTIIRECLNAGRTILVLSKRKEVLKTLYKLFKNEVDCALVISETNNIKDSEREHMENTARVIFGINQLALEGLDIPRLDTEIILHVISDTEQPVGRIIRQAPDKKQPIAITLLDNCHAYLGIYRKSHKFVQINAELKPIISHDPYTNKVTQLRKILN